MKKNDKIQKVIDEAIELALQNQGGKLANYIPELVSVSEDLLGVAVRLPDGTLLTAGNANEEKITLQSAGKLVILIGMIEELGLQQLHNWVRVEPSGDDFASVARLDQFGPIPSNPMLNSGTIALCAHLPGNAEQKHTWLKDWLEKLFGTTLSINPAVLASERRTGDRNRSIAYLLKSNNIIDNNIEEILDLYFSLCSYEATVVEATYLPALLANQGVAPDGTQVISPLTAQQTMAILATCGLYNESGSHLARTGMPAKSSVSGFILACVPKRAGIATIGPKVNRKGTSLRGELILQHISKELDWHFGS